MRGRSIGWCGTSVGSAGALGRMFVWFVAAMAPRAWAVTGYCCVCRNVWIDHSGRFRTAAKCWTRAAFAAALATHAKVRRLCLGSVLSSVGCEAGPSLPQKEIRAAVARMSFGEEVPRELPTEEQVGEFCADGREDVVVVWQQWNITAAVAATLNCNLSNGSSLPPKTLALSQDDVPVPSGGVLILTRNVTQHSLVEVKVLGGDVGPKMGHSSMPWWGRPGWNLGNVFSQSGRC